MSNQESTDLSEFEGQFSDSENPLASYTPEMMARRLVWDIVPCSAALKAIEAMDLPKVSSDVEQIEHDEAHQRALLLLPVIGVLTQMSLQIALVQLTAIQQEDPRTTVTMEQIFALVFPAVKASIIELLSMGYFHYPLVNVTVVGDPGVDCEEQSDE